MKFILGKKLEMTQKFREKGEVVPITVILAGPCTIVQLKTKEKDDYEAVQIGFGEKKKITKPLKGHFKNLGNFRHLKEFRVEEEDLKKIKTGDKINVSIFKSGEKVQITGISKGKGFAGVVKRHGFHGSPASHGHKDQLRMPGSIGSTDAARVFKGTRMAGRMGGERVTVKNLEIFDIDKEKNLLYVKGAVPGTRNSLVLISGEGEINVKSVETQDVAPAPEEVKDVKGVENIKKEEKKEKVETKKEKQKEEKAVKEK